MWSFGAKKPEQPDNGASSAKGRDTRVLHRIVSLIVEDAERKAATLSGATLAPATLTVRMGCNCFRSVCTDTDCVKSAVARALGERGMLGVENMEISFIEDADLDACGIAVQTATQTKPIAEDRVETLHHVTCPHDAAQSPFDTLKMPIGIPSATPAPAHTKLQALTGIASETGWHPRNEDRCAMATSRAWAISDGFGDAPYGDAAAQIAVNVAAKSLSDGLDVAKSFEIASEKVRWLAERTKGSKPNADCTLLLCALQDDDSMSFAWAGDSMAFLCRTGEMQEVTSPDEAGCGSLEPRSEHDGFAPRSARLDDLQAGDAILLCTDGVWRPFEGREQELATIISSAANAPWAAHNVVAQAVKAGHANASAIVLFLEEAEQHDESPLRFASNGLSEGQGSDGKDVGSTSASSDRECGPCNPFDDEWEADVSCRFC